MESETKKNKNNGNLGTLSIVEARRYLTHRIFFTLPPLSFDFLPLRNYVSHFRKQIINSKILFIWTMTKVVIVSSILTVYMYPLFLDEAKNQNYLLLDSSLYKDDTVDKFRSVKLVS